MEKCEVIARGIRFSIKKGDIEIAHAYLYVLRNDLHDQPFGLLEDVKVEEKYRSTGVGHELVAMVISQARLEKCYKLIATSRDDGTRDSIHEWYVRLGFLDYGTEFRMNF